MQVSCVLVDWGEATKRQASGTLDDDMSEYDEDSDVKWIYYLNEDEWPSDSAIQFFSVVNAYQAIFPHLTGANRNNSEASFSIVFRNDELIHDLASPVEHEWTAEFAPSRLRTMAEASRNVDYDEYLSLYSQHCPVDDKETLDPPEENFIRYLKQWSGVWELAVKKNMGIMASIG